MTKRRNDVLESPVNDENAAWRSIEKVDEVIRPRWMRDMQALDEVIRPRWMREIRSARRLSATDFDLGKVADLLKPGDELKAVAALRKSAIGMESALGKAADLVNPVGDFFPDLTKSAIAVGKADDLVNRVGDLFPVFAVGGTLRDLERSYLDRYGCDTFAELFRPVELMRSERPSICEAMDHITQHLSVQRKSDETELWRRIAPDTLAPALGILTKFERPSAVLTAIPGRDVLASLTWLDRRDEMSQPDLRLAALCDETAAPVSSSSQWPEIAIEAIMFCLICEQPMFSMVKRVAMVTPTKRSYEYWVLPICSTCQRRSMDDPNYVLNALEQLGSQTPRLKLIEGGGLGDGKRIGDLRIVRNDDEDE